VFPDEPNDEEREEELPGDNSTPFRPADDNTGASSNDISTTGAQPPLDDTHPATDTDIAPEEVYDSGISKAAEATDPHATGPKPQAFPLEPQDEDQANEEE
jgi:hypothetical protein